MPDAPLAPLLYSWWGHVFAAVWGALWGSFFNVAIHRLHVAQDYLDRMDRHD